MNVWWKDGNEIDWVEIVLRLLFVAVCLGIAVVVRWIA